MSNDGQTPDTLVSILPSYHPPPLPSVHKVTSPTVHNISLPPEINIDLTHIPYDHTITTQRQPILRKTIRMHRLAKDAIQGDTGANCSATNNLALLWHYQPLKHPIPIITYQGKNKDTPHKFEAIGTGIIKMIVEDTTINWLTLYTPDSTGTIISPDRYMMDNGHVEEFLQSGTRNGRGYLQFINSKGRSIAKVKMKRQRDGLWYTDSPVLLPRDDNDKDTDTQPVVISHTQTQAQPQHLDNVQNTDHTSIAPDTPST
jgi:hypothetical protein